MTTANAHSHERLFTPPNLLSFARLITAPLVLLLFAIDSLAGQIATLAFLLVSFTTDYLDGMLARRLKLQSDLGRMLDPLADKAVVIALLAATVLFRGVPLFFIAAIASRDILILGGGLLVKIKKGIILESNIWGKAATFVLMAAFLFFVFRELALAGYVLLWAGLALIAVSLITYTVLFVKTMRAPGRRPDRRSTGPTKPAP
jgi:cardiolipin synthase (CMP-forming)